MSLRDTLYEVAQIMYELTHTQSACSHFHTLTLTMTKGLNTQQYIALWHKIGRTATANDLAEAGKNTSAQGHELGLDIDLRTVGTMVRPCRPCLVEVKASRTYHGGGVAVLLTNQEMVAHE